MAYSSFKSISGRMSAVIFTAVFGLMLTAPSGYYVSLGLVLALGGYQILLGPSVAKQKEFSAIVFIALLVVGVHLSISLYHQDFHKLGYLLSFLLLPVAVAAFRRVDFIPSCFYLGCALGSIGAAIVSIQQYGGLASRASGFILNPISFGNVALMLATVSGIALGINSFSLKQRAVHLMGFICGLTACALSGSKGPWLAIPVVIAGVVIFLRNNLKSVLVKRAVVGMVILTFVSTLVFLAVNPTVQQVPSVLSSILSEDAERPESQALKGVPREGSLSPRYAMWKHFFSTLEPQQIIIGRSRTDLWQAQIDFFGPSFSGGYRTPAAHLHNDFLELFAHTGIIGVAIIAYFVWHLITLFFTSLLSANEVRRAIGAVGIIFLLEVLVFGLTNATLHSGPRMACILVLISAVVGLCLRQADSLEIDKKPNN